MLVLSRKSGQRIMLAGGEIHITVLRIQGKRVRLGIQAPAGMVVYREEVLARKKTAARTVSQAMGSATVIPPCPATIAVCGASDAKALTR